MVVADATPKATHTATAPYPRATSEVVRARTFRVILSSLSFPSVRLDAPARATEQVEPFHRARAELAPSDPLVQNVAASLVILSLAFLGARRLNRFLKEILK